MTAPEQDDLTAQGDAQVEQTDNGLRPDDPEEQPPQDPSWVPDGSASEGQQ